MRVMSIEALAPGLSVASPLFNELGGVLLRSGTELSAAYLDLLRRRGVGALWINDPDTSDIVAADVLSEATRTDATRNLAKLLFAVRHKVERVPGDGGQLVRDHFQSPEFRCSMAELPYWEMSDTVGSIVEEAAGADLTKSILGVIKTFDTYEFTHAVDTAATAIILGCRLGLDGGSLRRLARGCLLHDIGMVFVDRRILTRAGPLDANERAAIEQHPRLGYEFLARLHPDDLIVNQIALQHHERQDGTGYPRGLRGTNTIHRRPLERGRGQILLLAEIAAVVDVYHALIADHPHRSALTPEAALQVMRQMAGSWLNRRMVDEFIRLMPPYPLATEVIIAEGPLKGSVGVVCRVVSGSLDRPVIRLLANAHGERIKPMHLDLRRVPSVRVRGLGARGAQRSVEARGRVGALAGAAA